jgi:predicted PurR-regulated permease PerM
MASLILGIVIGIVLSIILAFIGWGIYGCLYETWAEITCVVTTVILCIVLSVLITFGMCSYEKATYTRYIDRYTAVKETIEESIDSNEISGLERLQLVQNAIDENTYLAGLKFDCDQWYGFLINQNVKKLEPINFE